MLTELPDVPPCHVVLVRPGFGVSTAQAYCWHDEQRVGPSPPVSPPADSSGWADVLSLCANDLEVVVVGHHPEIEEIVAKLRRCGAALARMSGSGSACFGLFASPDAAARAAAACERAGWLTLVTSTLDRAAYLRLTQPTRVA